MDTDLFFVATIVIITLGVVIIFALLTAKNSNKTASYLLVGLVVLFIYYALIKILSNTNTILEYPHLIRTYRPLFILACSLIYLYSKAITVPNFRLNNHDVWHFAPFILYSLLMLPFFLESPEFKIASLSWQPFTLIWTIERSFWVVVLVFYLTASYKVVIKYQQNIKNIFSNIEKIKLNWLKYLLLAFGVVWFSALFRFLSTYGKVGYENKFIVPILLCLVIFLIAAYAIRQPAIFNNSLTDYGKPKYKYSNLSEIDMLKYKDKLTNYFEHEKPYINPELKLQDLVDYLNLPSYQISQILNAQLHQNFYEFVNSARVVEAQKLLADPAYQHLTILDIAYDVGFNSKSAFNNAFKNYTKTTPSSFKKSHTIQ